MERSGLAAESTWIPRDARILLGTRALRGFADGLTSVLLPAYLTGIGLGASRIGAVVTSTLLGSAALTLTVGLWAYRVPHRRALLGAAALMVATGLAFALREDFWSLLVIAFIGTINPSAGDVSVFLPLEQAVLASTVPDGRRTGTFAWYNLLAAFAGALGALASGLPGRIAAAWAWHPAAAQRLGFIAYAIVGALVAFGYARLSVPSAGGAGAAKHSRLARSRGVVIRLAALFSMDSFGGGFTVQSLLVLWLYRRFGLSVETTGAVFFATGLLSACSQLASPWLAARIGLVRTMVYTHLPSNALLVLAAFAPSATLAVACLFARSLLSQLDVPARQSYVMAMVPPEERAAAASVTNVPRSLASALPPLAAGWMLERSSFGWPLLIAGIIKAVYDLLLLAQFHAQRPPHER